MADEETTSGGGGGGLFEGRPVAGIPRPLFVGGIIVAGVGAAVWLWKRKQNKGQSSSTTTVITGSSSTSLDNAMLDAILKNWQQHPASTSTSTAASGTGTGGGSGPGGGGGSSTQTGTGTTIPAGGPGTTTDESGNMHGISLAQALYLFQTGNMPYVYNPQTGAYTRWSGSPVAGQTYYAGPLNWQDNLKGGQITGGTAGHPTYAASASSATAKKPAAKKPAPAPPKKK